MKKTYLVAIGLCATFGVTSINAQTLFTFGNHPVTKAEFIRIYEKNNAQKHPDYSAASVKEYLDLYSLFRMKVQEAEDMQLDTTLSVKSELNNYKNQLAKSYLFDKDVTNNLVKEAYERSKNDVRVAHILVAVRPSDDSIKAKNKIDSIYNLITDKKEDFATLAKSFSDDKSTSDKGGELGYITVMQITYPFETVAYETPVGKISKPFRTQFGWHILKVEDKRPAQGQVQVAQIMISSPASKGETGQLEAMKKAQQIEQELNNGKSFEELVKTYSEDKFTKNNNGVMDPFGIGQITPEFESAAFSLKNPGDISKPLQTEYGVHILKLIKKIPLKSYDDIKDELSRKIENDARSATAKEAYTEKVKNDFHFKEYPQNLNDFLSAFAYDTSKMLNKADYASFQKPLFELNKKVYTQNDFLDFAYQLTNGKIFGNKVNSLKDIYKAYQTSTIQNLQQENLETTNPEFKSLVAEYKNGIMLFDLMDKKVWSKASTDTAGLEQFYKKNATKYQWKPGFEGTVYTSSNQTEITKLKSMVDGGMSGTDALEKLSENDAPISTVAQTGRYEFEKFPISSNDFKTGTATKIYQNEDHTYSFVHVINVFKEQKAKTLEEAKGFVIADYQDFLEKEWNQQLKAKYPLDIKEKVLTGIIK